MTSKQRAYLKGLAMTMDPILQLGKGGLTPENTAAVDEALAAIKDNPQRRYVRSVRKNMRNLKCVVSLLRTMRIWHYLN